MSLALPDFIKRAAAYFDKADANLTASEALATANAKITALTGQVTTAQTALATKDTELKNAQAALEAEKRKTVEVLAGQGLPPGDLPASETNANTGGAPTDAVTKLRDQLSASTDPQEKY